MQEKYERNRFAKMHHHLFLSTFFLTAVAAQPAGESAEKSGGSSN